MKKTFITSQTDSLYEEFKAIYTTSFPIFEQRTEAQQLKAFSHPAYQLIAYTENDQLIGFLSLWNFPAYCYIEHFAIHPARRGKGTGSIMLKKLITETTKTILLEIDPIVDEISEKRLRFYQHNGFQANPYLHIHPPYRNNYSGHHLIVLSTPDLLTAKTYQQFKTDLEQLIMQ